MDESNIPQSAAFRIQLPSFEGPLDLLLHLIKKHELDVLDLPIAFVTERYLEYLDVMQVLDLDVASEYLLMAATLAHIKSKMLLPQTPTDTLEEQEEAYQEDPRAELIRRLLEYQKYRAAAEQLGARPQTGRDVFARGTPAVEAQGPAPLASFDLYKLLDAFQSILKRVQGRVALEVSAETITIHERMTQLSDLLRVKRSCTFEELFAGDRTRYEVVVTFLALLEMTKLRMTRIYQADPRSSIHVQYALLDADSPTVPPEDGAAEPIAAPDAWAEVTPTQETAATHSDSADAPTTSDLGQEDVAFAAVAYDTATDDIATDDAVNDEPVNALSANHAQAEAPLFAPSAPDDASWAVEDAQPVEGDSTNAHDLDVHAWMEEAQSIEDDDDAAHDVEPEQRPEPDDEAPQHDESDA